MADALSKYQKKLRDAGRSESTIKEYLAHLLAALSWAVNKKWLPAVPKVKQPKRAKKAKVMRGRAITTEEFERMLDKVPAVVAPEHKKKERKKPIEPERRRQIVDRDGYRVFYKNEAGPSFEQKWTDSPAHYQNFIDCVKSREQEKLVADIEEGHYSVMLCHLGNIAYRTGRRLEFDPKSETFVGDEQANQLLSREYRKGYELPTI